MIVIITLTNFSPPGRVQVDLYNVEGGQEVVIQTSNTKVSLEIWKDKDFICVVKVNKVVLHEI